MKNDLKSLLKRLWTYIGRRRHLQIFALLLLTVASSVSEIISIGAVLPFLAVLTEPQKIYNLSLVGPLIEFMGIKSPRDLLFVLAVVFGMAILIAGSLRLLVIWANARFSLAVGVEINADIYRKTLYQPYLVHASRNSSEMISALLIKTNSVMFGIISPILAFISSLLIAVSILVGLFVIDPQIALISFGGFGGLYLLIAKGVKRKLAEDSELTTREANVGIKAMQEGLGGIRDVLLDSSQEVYCNIYRRADISLRRAQARTIFISQSPRYLMEALGMILIISLAFFLADKQGGVSEAIPKLGALALGAQRLLPALQQMYWAITTIQSSKSSLVDVLGLLDQPLPGYVKELSGNGIQFEKEICLRNVGFRYDNSSPWVLKGINLTIKKGERIGLIGSTGSGKSTLVDILMGLLEPTIGTISVDGINLSANNYRLWQRHIAHVPQSIFLSDSSVKENIAFGNPPSEIKDELVEIAAEHAQISETIKSWPNQYDSFVGERGVKLSGGQRQRIGIARALYKMSDVIVFDEATSALDSETEKEVMGAIDSLSNQLTIIMIAHRLSTLHNCNLIVELNDGKITRTGSYQEVVDDYRRV